MLRQAVVIIVAGVVVGILAAAFLATSLSHVLYGIRPHDPLTFVSAPIIIMAVAGLACLIPARRAVKVDPLRGLRAG